MERCFCEGLRSAQIARILDLSPSCVQKRRIQYDREQTIPTSPRSSHASIITPALLHEIDSLCEHLPLPTAGDIVKFLSPENSCSISTCRTALKILNFSYKKVITVCAFFFFVFFSLLGIHHLQVPDRRNYEGTKEKRIEFINKLEQFPLNMILSLDESGFNRQMHRLFAWSPVGDSATHVVPTARGRNVSLCAIMGAGGILASAVFVGAINTTRLLDFIESWPLDDCKGKCVILDNVSFHHSSSVYLQLFFLFRDFSYT